MNQMSQMSQRRGKDASVSLIRMMAMSFIIVCHIFQTYDSELAWWFNVGVQIFLIISGYLYCSKDYSKESPIKILKKQFKKILIPYYFWLPIVVLLYYFLCPQHLSLIGVVKYILCCGVLEGQGHFWFIPYILFCYLITPYLYWIKSSVKDYNLTRTLIVYCCAMALCIVLSSAFKSYFNAAYVVCYILGYFLKDIFVRFEGKRTFNLIFAITLCITALMCGGKIYLLYINPMPLDGIMAKIFNIFKAYTHLLLGLTIFLSILKIPSVKYNSILAFSDNYSYEIFIVHCLFIRGSFHLLYITDYTLINVIIAVCGTIVTGVLYKTIYKFICKKLNISI